MKKIYACIISAGLLFMAVPTTANTSAKTTACTNQTAGAAEAEVLLTRLNEIKTLSENELSSPEKKKLRKEVRSIQQTLAHINGGVYISVGALILIIVLLIILL